MIFRLSQRLNNKIKAGPLSAAPMQINPYADWSARIFTANRTQYILLSNTPSLYSVVMLGREITNGRLFVSRALKSIHEFLSADGMSLIYENFLAPAATSVRCCKPLNRSVTGCMNELEFMAKYCLESGECSPVSMALRLNGLPLSALRTPASGNYATPSEAFRRLAIQPRIDGINGCSDH